MSFKIVSPYGRDFAILTLENILFLVISFPLVIYIFYHSSATTFLVAAGDTSIYIALYGIFCTGFVTALITAAVTAFVLEMAGPRHVIKDIAICALAVPWAQWIKFGHIIFSQNILWIMMLVAGLLSAVFLRFMRPKLAPSLNSSYTT